MSGQYVTGGVRRAAGADRELGNTTRIDIVGDRHRLLLIGMAAVWIACVTFAPARLWLTLTTGRPTPWWVNVIGAIAITVLYLWYRRSPLHRAGGAVHGTALIATIALLVPVAYGLTSTIWWLSLVGFGAVLLGRRREALIWGTAIPLTVMAANLLEPFAQLEPGAREPSLETGLARSVFVVLLVVMAAAFRIVAERRAVAFHASEERYRLLFTRAPIGVFRYNRDFVVTDCNARFEETVGARRRGLVGVDLTAVDVGGRLQQALGTALAGGEGSYDGILECARDGRRHVSLRTAPLHDPEGELVGAIGTLEDVTERRRVEDELRQTTERLKLLTRKLVEVQEEERRAIARELHDEAGQALTAISLHLTPLERANDEASRRSMVEQTRTLLRDAMESLHALSARLRPVVLDRLGLDRAINQLAQTASAAGLDVRCTVEGIEQAGLPPEVEITVYRAVQEAVNNALKHARAQALEVSVTRRAAHVEFEVTDDGVGCDLDQVRQSTRLGLSGMVERMELIGGSLRILSSPHGGTRVHGEIDL